MTWKGNAQKMGLALLQLVPTSLDRRCPEWFKYMACTMVLSLLPFHLCQVFLFMLFRYLETLGNRGMLYL